MLITSTIHLYYMEFAVAK